MIFQLNDKKAMTQLLNKHKKGILRVSLSVILSFTFLFSNAQKKGKAYLSIDYKQYVNEYNLVEVTIRTRVDGKFQPISNVPIDITMDTKEDELLLATINSDENGFASLAIAKDYSFYRNEEGKYKINAKFNGNDTYKKVSKNSKMKYLYMQANLTVEDSVKTIYLNALEYIKDSLTIPAEDIDFEVFVDRMFADLKITEGVFTNGKAQVIFPDDIPGDLDGNIIIRVIVDERDYQMVELTLDESWGVPLIEDVIKKKNAATISYVAFMILSIIIIAISGLLLSKRINNKS